MRSGVTHWQSIGEAEELFNFRDLQSGADPRLYRHQQKSPSIFLPVHVNAHQSANAGGVNIRNTGKIQRQRL